MNVPYELTVGQAVGVTVPALNKLLATQDAPAALFFCYLLAHPEPLDLEQAEYVLGMPERELKRAFVALRDAELLAQIPMGAATPVITAPAKAAPAPAPAPIMPIAKEKPKKGLVSDERPAYENRHISGSMKNDVKFKELVDASEQKLGKLLSSGDMQILYSLYDWRGLSAGVISLLISHCISEAAEKNGPGAKPTMRQIEKEGAVWERENITDESRAEEYIRSVNAGRSRRSQILQVLQIRGRAPSATEDRYIREWVKNTYDTRLIAMAYDRTTLRTGGMSWKYMDTILRSWREKGLTTPEEVENGDIKSAAPRAVKPPIRETNASAPAVGGDDLTAGERAAVDDLKDFIESLRAETGVS